MLQGAIQKVTQCKNHYISNLFLTSKKDVGNRPVINLKHLNNFIPYQHFKMEGLNLLQSMLQEKDFMCKLDLKDAYFCVPLKKESRKYVRFQWEVTLYEFLSLFRARSSTTDICKSSKNTYFITKKATDQGNNLFRRHTIDVTNKRAVNQQGHCDISADTSTFCNQPEKINAESSTKNQISGPGNRLSCNEIITTSRGRWRKSFRCLKMHLTTR